MLLLISIFIVILLFAGMAGLVGKLAPSSDFPTKSVALALCISIISYAYWLGLVFHLGFNLTLLIIFSVGVISYPLTSGFPRKLNLNEFIPESKIAFAVSVAILFLTLHFNKYVYRWGDWDAWAIWNLHAKFLFDSGYWKNMFTENMAITHPDYPLMLPTLIAFFWKTTGNISPIAPIMLAYVIFLAVPLTTFKALRTEKKPVFAFVMLLIFLADPKYLSIAGSQYADTLVGFFILISFIIYQSAKHFPDKHLFILLGFVAAATTWIKNEGLLFYTAFTFSLFCFHYRQPLLILKYVSGSALPIVVLVSFKLLFAPANDLIHGERGADLIAMLLQPERYLLIFKHFLQTIFSWYWIILLLLGGVLVRGKYSIRSFPTMVILIVICGYFAVYLTTPHDLEWHLGASIDRVLHHIYPATLYLLLKNLSESRFRESVNFGSSQDQENIG